MFMKSIASELIIDSMPALRISHKHVEFHISHGSFFIYNCTSSIRKTQAISKIWTVSQLFARQWESRLTYEWHRFRSGRHLLSNEQHKHREGQEYRETQTDLLSRGRRQPEREQGQNWEHHTGDDDVEQVVKCASGKRSVYDDVMM